MANEYEVGYKRPPKETQFAKGQSGNPKGRPAGTRNLNTMFNAIALEMITVTENGRAKTMTRIEAVLHRVMNLALSAEPRAMKEVLRLFAVSEEAMSANDVSSVPQEREVAVFQSLLKRMQRIGQETSSEKGSTDGDGK
jgi:hypothetical protein